MGGHIAVERCIEYFPWRAKLLKSQMIGRQNENKNRSNQLRNIRKVPRTVKVTAVVRFSFLFTFPIPPLLYQPRTPPVSISHVCKTALLVLEVLEEGTAL